jgi:hypothetical protein
MILFFKRALPPDAMAMPPRCFLLWLLFFSGSIGLFLFAILHFNTHPGAFATVVVSLLVYVFSGGYLAACYGEIRENALRTVFRSDAGMKIDFTRRFGHSDFVHAGFFPDQTTIDPNEPSFIGSAGKIDFSFFAAGIVGSRTRGGPTFSKWGEFLFFRLPVGEVESNFMLLPGVWKRHFGIGTGIRMMGRWFQRPPVLPIDGSRYPHFAGMQAYGGQAAPELLSALHDMWGDLPAFSGRKIYLSVRRSTLYLAIPSKLRISLFSAAANRRKIETFRGQVKCVIDPLNALSDRFLHKETAAAFVRPEC